MNNIMYMGTTGRHNELVTFLIGKVLHLIEKKEIYAWHENCPLVYYAPEKLSNGLNLVDIKDIKNMDHFIENVITELDHIKPDFMMFKDNPYVHNKKQTRTAGQPDLIVEIWSESNTDNDRAFIQKLYASSPVTEHWYIEQDSNKVECYLGKGELPTQYLTDILVTQKGIEFDLRYLAIEN